MRFDCTNYPGPFSHLGDPRRALRHARQVRDNKARVYPRGARVASDFQAS